MISALRLQQFRSYSDDSFEFEPGVNIVVGPNACGKTNLLEGILVLATGGSYRGYDQNLITHNKDWARLDGVFDGIDYTLKLEQVGESITKTYEIDEVVKKRPVLQDLQPVVIFEPDHLQLLLRGPEIRREYIDDLLEQTEPGFKNVKSHYRRALAQRNRLLKQPVKQAAPQLFVWNIRLSELGAKIVSSRLGLVGQVNELISTSYSRIAKKSSEVEVAYVSSVATADYGSKLLASLEKNTELDFARGFTAVGPHRDDISVLLNGQPAANSASRGEVRTLLLALKIFELELVEQARGKRPVLLLDDVFSELDGSRRRYLVQYLKKQQTIITTTDADAVVQHFTAGHNLIAMG